MKKHIIFVLMIAMLSFFAFACSKEKEPEKEKGSLTFGNVVLEMKEGDTQNITFTINSGSLTVSFSSSDNSILKVGSDGKVEALKEGTATITAKVNEDDSLSKTFTIKVTREIKKFTYKFVVEGEVVKEETLEEGSTITPPADPKKAGNAEYSYTFKGWDKEITTLTSDITFTALFEQTKNKYVVTMDVDGKMTTEEVEYGTEFDLPTLVKDGYNFIGWEKDGALIDKLIVTENVTIVAKFEEALATLTLVNNGNETKETYHINEEVTLEALTLEGYTFKGWHKDGETTYITTIKMDKDYKVIADFEQIICTITYELDGGTASNLVESAPYGTTVKFPTATKDNYRFQGWIMDGLSTILTQVVLTHDITVRALFVEIEYKLTFELNGGSTTETLPTYAKANQEITLPTLTKDGFTFLGWEKDGSIISKLVVTEDTILVAKFQKVLVPVTVTMELNGGKLLTEAAPAYKDSTYVLPTPVKNGFVFVGWTIEGQTEFVKELVDLQGDVKVIAHYEASDIVYVGEGFYETFDDALAAVNDGSTICFLPGTYNKITITKAVTITSLNQGLNPNITKFYNEAEFIEDLEVKASGVTFDAITLTQKGRINVTGDFANITIRNVREYGNTLNAAAADSNTAPFYFIGGSGSIVKNIVIDQCLFELRETGRPMIIYGYDIEDLTITNSCFYGGTVKSNYNDGIKIASTKDNANIQFGIRGNVLISGNTFVNYYQYVIWFRGYSDGKFDIINNKFTSIGQTAANHAMVTFITNYCTPEGEFVVNAKYNSVESGVMLIRMDESPANGVVTANYNKMIDCNGDFYIKNSGSSKINAEYNYFGVSTPDEGKFKGVETYANYYEKAEDVKNIYDDNDEAKHTITYDLNGGTWTASKLTIDDTIELLLAALTEYYGVEVTASNVHEISEASETPRMFKFFEKEEWKWLKDYLVYCRTNDQSQSGGVSYLTDTSGSYCNTYWRYEVAGFLNKKAWASWPYSADYASIDFIEYFDTIAILGKVEEGPSEFLYGKGLELPTPVNEGFAFTGWCDEKGNTFTEIPFWYNEDINLIANWAKAIEPNDIIIKTDLSGGIELYSRVQLEWEFDPLDTYNQNISFISSNEKVFTIGKTGLITANGGGTATLKIKVDANSDLDKTIVIKVYKPDHFDISYDTDSYVEVDKQIKLNAKYVTKAGDDSPLVWESYAPSTVSVDENGLVTGLQDGEGIIRCTLASDETKYVEFVVTVLSNRMSDAMKYVVASHNSNIFTEYDLGIGAGTPAYYMDILGSISKVLFNEELVIDRKYESVQAGVDSNHGGVKTSTEFICVHYTGNMARTATAAANANYFATGGGGTSIHYVTGNDGVYSVLDDTLVGFHAGDGTSVKFEWIKTGVKYASTDPETPVFGINSNSYYTINGKDTTIPVPEGTTAQTKKVTDARWINKMGLAFKVENGEYYMGTTWWCYSQVAEGRLCNKGGNLNSIGIESAVNQGTDLWYTWHRTAKLVAQLMVDNNLDITRVVGHHFFTAKDCPQPLLENNLEIWHEFIEMVKAEYLLITEFKDYEFEVDIFTESPYVNSLGRVSLPNEPLVISYEVTITNKTTHKSESIVLSSAVNGVYSK